MTRSPILMRPAARNDDMRQSSWRMRAYSSGATTGDSTKSSAPASGSSPARRDTSTQSRTGTSASEPTSRTRRIAARPDLQVRPGVDHDHRRPLQLDVLGQLIDVVADGDHLAAEIAQRRRRAFRAPTAAVAGLEVTTRARMWRATLSGRPRRSNRTLAALPPANIKIMFLWAGSCLGAPESG